MKTFLFALLTRILLFVILYCSFPNQNISALRGDPLEYYNNAQNLENTRTNPEIVYTYWWERSPLYTLFIHIFNPYAIFAQMIIGSLGVVWMWRMNKKAGLIWSFWECWYSIIYYKECLMYAMIIFIIYKVKN
jgi:hypothetical protein